MRDLKPVCKIAVVQAVPESCMEHNVCGHYARPDVLKLTATEK